MGKTIEKRFWNKVKKIQECWIWTGARDKDGYGKITINGKSRRTHRVSYEMAIGEIPTDFSVCHKCDNPPCVRPNHLFVGTTLDNQRDKISKGRGNDGERNGRAKLSIKDVHEIRKKYATGEYSQNEIAKEFGVIQNLISKIVLNQIWKHI